MSDHNNDCQPLITELQAAMEPYLDILGQLNKGGQKDTRLCLNHEQMLLFSALYGEKDSSAVLMLPSPTPQAKTTTEQLNTLSRWIAGTNEWHLIEGSLSPQEEAGDVVSRLSQTIHHLLAQTPHHHFVVPIALLAARFPSRAAYHARHLTLHQHESMPLSRLAKELSGAGYTRYESAQEPGSFSVRGENIDLVFPHTSERFTLVFHGASIEQIIHSSLLGQGALRRRMVRTLTIPPAAFPPSTTELRELIQPLPLIKPAAAGDSAPPGFVYDALQTDYPFPLTPASVEAPSAPLYLVYENHDRVAEYAAAHRLEVAAWCQNEIARIPLALQHERFVILSESAMFKKTARPARRSSGPGNQARGYTLVAELTPNKPAVHSDHGIGIFEGLMQRTIDTRPREYLILRYAAGDTLSVPVEYAHKVTPYLGEKYPTINRLSGSLWKKTRRQAQHDAEAFARELLELAGKRKNDEVPRYTIDPALRESLAKSFPHELTPDQHEALSAIEDDLQKPYPLDRLVVGDVGFGKTELALRAARHVMAAGKQVALLAPTTLLVQQHSDTARQRFPELANRIGVLSRFASPREQKEVRQKIADGAMQLVIGTHALLAASTQWHQLGLVIIDEEQRFGVKHKEHFKKIRATVDFLSLSATPIPRTLSMALTGLKELSIITTPPPGRQEVLTVVTRFNETTLQQSIERELKRGGQVYIVAPKVRSLGSLKHEVAALVPTARIAVAHGQLPPAELAAAMEKFDRGEIDILISSTIIENGLDLPNANTMIVMQATYLGLGDLYQLRGRVGRRSRQGYAYFFYNQDELTPLQRQRLTALTEASRLGAGWSLAQRDLEIRGAGNLLGAEQSGSVNQIGVQLYLDMVHDAIAQHSEPTLRRHDVDIKLPLAALIPKHYIADDGTRSRYYQQLGRAATPEELDSLARRLADAFGTLPDEVTNLVLLLNLQHRAARASISEIASQPITPSDEDPYWRLSITTKKVPETLQKLQSLGNWSVRNNTLTHDLNDITPDFLQKLITALLL